MKKWPQTETGSQTGAFTLSNLKLNVTMLQNVLQLCSIAMNYLKKLLTQLGTDSVRCVVDVRC